MYYISLLPRDAMLARYTLWPCVRLSVSVTSRCSVKTDERIELVFGMGPPIPALCYKEITVLPEIRVGLLFLLKLCPNSGLRKFRYDILTHRLSKRIINLASNVDAQSVID